jgi:hypothetical protein
MDGKYDGLTDAKQDQLCIPSHVLLSAHLLP